MTKSAERLSAALADRYRIIRQLGEGGMATVYLAEDLKHGRNVAVKVLRQELAAVLGAERFVQEIKTTANLQHPHILPLFDSGEADGFLYYVMPFIDGETLRNKLDRETQLGIDEAVRIAREVADALDYAHRHGVIHRDIKPENILLHDGRPVVADFGIALAVSAAAGGRMTETGLSLGTPYYMSPEQATAEKEITARSDVYSLGSVLYEMLVGDPPHTGSSAQQIVMKIIADEARPVTELRKSVPPNVAAAVAKSLEKLPADRFASAAEFGTALTETGFAHRQATGPAAPVSGLSWPRWLQPVEGAVIAGLVLALIWSLTRSESAPAPRVMRTLLADSLPAMAGLAMSPDGSRIIVALTGTNGWGLYWRQADELEFRPVPGTEESFYPHFSPDGKWVGFTQIVQGASTLSMYRKVPVTGGPAVLVTDSMVGAAHWGRDGSIAASRVGGLYFQASGSEAFQRIVERVSDMNPEQPFVLPDGSGVLFSSDGQNRGRVMLWDRQSGELRQIAPDGKSAQYIPTGHIIYLSGAGSDLFSVPFDLGKNEVSGNPVPILENVWAPIGGASGMAISDDGTLLYATAISTGDDERLTWVDETGTAVDLPIRVDDFEDPRISPDGRFVAYNDFLGNTIAVYDQLTGSNTTLPVNGKFAWAADGRSLYVSNEYGLVRVSTGGTGAVDTLTRTEVDPYSASKDGAWLVAGMPAGAVTDLVMVPLQGNDHEPLPYLHADWDEYQGVISPDGRWLAYISTETGEAEVFIRSFPEPGLRMQASVGGGVGPAWAPDGGAVYFVNNGSLVRGDFRAGDSPGVYARTALFGLDDFETSDGVFMRRIRARRRYDVHPDGRRFLMVRSSAELFDVRQPVVVVTNWFEELRAKMREP